jgi:hypothetical protein
MSTKIKFAIDLTEEDLKKLEVINDNIKNKFIEHYADKIVEKNITNNKMKVKITEETKWYKNGKRVEKLTDEDLVGKYITPLFWINPKTLEQEMVGIQID